MNTSILIPAYQPTMGLVDVVERLSRGPVERIVVIDDGSGPSYSPVFERVAQCHRTEVLRHVINLGKGAALKTGINHCLCLDVKGLIVTADADGQHHPEDILRVAAAGAGQGAVVLGVRAFDAAVPFRSRLGNELTRRVLRLVLGYALQDTQTGLRAIPAEFAPNLLKLTSRRYEFELDMLVLCKQMGVPISQVQIRTIYLDGNSSSHFNPLVDSMRIYFSLLRFMVVSLSTAIIDNVAFALLFATLGQGGSLRQAVLFSQAGARLVAMAFNYSAVKRLVFASHQPAHRVVPKYLALVVFSAALSYSAITTLSEWLGLNIVVTKLIVESALFIPNFVIQRDLVFQDRLKDEVVVPPGA
jgi:putative flippase GtrA